MYRTKFLPYDRKDPEAGNEHFGREVRLLSAREDVDLVSDTGDVSSRYPAATWSREDHVLSRPLEVTKRSTLTRLDDHVVLFPSGGLLTPDRGGLYRESLWGARLFHSPYARNDKSTGWRWRLAEDVGEIMEYGASTAYCYGLSYYQFYHFFADCLSKYYYLTEVAKPEGVERFLIGTAREGTFQRAALELLDFDFEKLVAKSDITTPFVRFKDLHFPVQTYQESEGLRPSYGHGLHYKGVFAEYFHYLRDRFVRGLKVRGVSTLGHPKIYLDRGKRGLGRRVTNELALVARLEAEGFVRLDAGSMSLEEQLASVLDAREVVGPHGAALAHLMWIRPGCKIVELMGEGYDDPGYRVIAGELGHEHNLVFGDVEEPHKSRSNYSIDIEQVLSMLR